MDLLQDQELWSQMKQVMLSLKPLRASLRAGIHEFQHRGRSLEFAEYREYRPGEDLRDLALEAAFERAEGNVEVEVTGRPTSIKTLEWERIHETLAETDFNISETARRLGMHRRTLARKLGKRQVK